MVVAKRDPGDIPDHLSPDVVQKATEELEE
jgi:hypothetical protein